MAAEPPATWRPLEDASHPLAALESVSVAGLRARVMLGPRSRFGAQSFVVFLERGGEPSAEPALVGLFQRGQLPAHCWAEVDHLRRAVRLGDQEVDLRASGAEGALLAALAALVPPGGHLMVEYDSRDQVDTERALAAGVPPAATRLGELLVGLGCIAFRDWYIPEGGREGPRKLQGYLPLDEAHQRRRLPRMVEELRTYLKSGRADGPHREARRRARRVLNRLLEQHHWLQERDGGPWSVP